MEHLHHFGLSEDPFRNEPRMRDFFETEVSRAALARLERGLRQSRGLLVLVGDKKVILKQLEGLGLPTPTELNVRGDPMGKQPD